MPIAAIVASVLLVVIAAFQIALALGAPWGAVAWGGQHPGPVPNRLRLASGVAGLVVYPSIILAVLEAGGLIVLEWFPDIGDVGMWILAGLFALGAVANFLSRSRLERWWGPVSLAVAVCCGVIALGL